MMMSKSIFFCKRYNAFVFIIAFKKMRLGLKTGSIQTFEQLKKKAPFELLELMDITGFGPATLKNPA